MLEVTREFIVAFDRRLERAAVPSGERPDYRKWVLFYLDFCQKYCHPPRVPTIDLQTVPSLTLKEARSPLDLEMAPAR